MTQKKIIKKIRFTYMFKTVLPLLFLLLILGWGRSYPFHTYYSLPSADSLSSLAVCAADKNPYVSISVDELYYTGYDLTGDTTAAYYYTLIEDNCVFFLLDKTGISEDTGIVKRSSVTGKIISDSDTISSIIDGMAADLSWTADELGKMSTTYIIDETSDNRVFYNICYVVTRFFIALSGLSVLKNICFLVFPRKSAAYRKSHATPQ